MPENNRYHKRPRRRRNRQRKLWLYGIVLISAIVFFTSRDSARVLGSENPIPESPTTFGNVWWDASYPFRKEITFRDGENGVAELLINHKELVREKKSLSTGNDLRIVAYTNSSDFKKVDHLLLNPNQTNTLILFDIAKAPKAEYFLYLGNRHATAPKTSSILGNLSNGDFPAKAGISELPAVSLNSNRYWNLIMPDGLEFGAKLKLDPVIADKRFTPEVYVVGKEGSFAAKYIEKTQEITANLSQLKPGKHEIYIRLKYEDGSVNRSNNLQIIASYPVYVAWTIDWEGRDVKDEVLTTIDSIAIKYKMPLTQFFNPRIYVAKDIPEYRSAELTNWVKARHILHKDEIALHMHMYFDMVEAAGVQSLQMPNWGSGYDGYDVLTSGYNYADFTKILKWGLKQFEDNNLPKPSGYRAGGWFADIENLKALNDLGFVYDSSGRESYRFGIQKKAGSWKLESTTQPYQPSSEDQNASVPEPLLNLWELPNNGNDSYWFDLRTLVSRFYANYPGRDVSTQPKLVTYLSHPDWFNVDQPKIEGLFKEIDKYSFNADRGPIIYTTLSTALLSWNK